MIRKIFLSIFILTLGLATACSSVPPKADHQPTFTALLIENKGDDKSLEDCVKNCPPEDADLARLQLESDKEYGSPLDSGRRDRNLKYISDLVNATELWFEKNKDSEEENVAAETYLYAITVVSSSGTVNPKIVARLKEKIYEALPALASRFPHSSRVALIQAMGSAVASESVEVQISEFKRCLEIDPAEGECYSGYKRAVQRYQLPSCPARGVTKGFGLYLSSPMRTEGFSREVTFKSGKVFLNEKSPFDPRDIVQIKLAETGDPKSKIFHTSLVIEFKAQAREKLRQITQKNLESELALVVKDRVYINEKIRTLLPEAFSGDLQAPMNNISLAASLGGTNGISQIVANVLFDQICATPVKPALPKRLIWTEAK